MLARALPFHDTDRKKTFRLIKESEPNLSGEAWRIIGDECKDLMLKMLIKNPKNRISVDDALKHPWFKKYEAHINKAKDDFAPIIDHETGQLKRPRRSSFMSSAMESRANILSKMQSIQQSMTNYAEMVDESGG